MKLNPIGRQAVSLDNSKPRVSDKSLKTLKQVLRERTRPISELGHFLLSLGFMREISMYGYIVDFVHFERKLIVEIDGPSHKQSAKRDRDRDDVFRSHGYTVLRIRAGWE